MTRHTGTGYRPDDEPVSDLILDIIEGCRQQDNHYFFEYLEALARSWINRVENTVASHRGISSNVRGWQAGDPRCWNRLSADKIAVEGDDWHFWASEPSWVCRFDVDCLHSTLQSRDPNHEVTAKQLRS